MTPSDVLNVIRDGIKDLKSRNVATITISDFEKYINSIEDFINQRGQAVAGVPLTEREMEQWKSQNQTKLKQWELETQSRISHLAEMVKGTFAFGGAALKSAILINGGAAVAFLAFIGNIWGEDKGIRGISELSSSMILFVYGVLSAAVATGTAYLVVPEKVIFSGNLNKLLGCGVQFVG